MKAIFLSIAILLSLPMISQIITQDKPLEQIDSTIIQQGGKRYLIVTSINYNPEEHYLLAEIGLEPYRENKTLDMTEKMNQPYDNVELVDSILIKGLILDPKIDFPKSKYFMSFENQYKFFKIEEECEVILILRQMFFPLKIPVKLNLDYTKDLMEFKRIQLTFY